MPLKGWVMLVSNEGLRCEIQAWVRSVGLDLDDLADAAYKSTDASSACADLGRTGVFVGASARGCAGHGSGAPCDQHAVLVTHRVFRKQSACPVVPARGRKAVYVYACI